MTRAKHRSSSLAAVLAACCLAGSAPVVGALGCASDKAEKKPMQPTQQLDADDQAAIRDRAGEDQDHLDEVMDRESERLRDERNEAGEIAPVE